ncbi:MAG: hypothetical protein COA38_16465 [Fluviicola sp.]|nr:MAG: hypothetical protein COA38_16465 [Fluviicola sp.]
MTENVNTPIEIKSSILFFIINLFSININVDQVRSISGYSSENNWQHKFGSMIVQTFLFYSN